MLQMQKILLLILVFASNTVFAQTDFIVQGNTSKLHLVHIVSPKESWFSIGRLYNISSKELAPYNGLSIEKPISIGQHINVPLKDINFSQNGTKAADEVFIPVYHVIQEKEWLYRISMNHNKVPVELLEKWNNVDKDHAMAGMPLIVGYLKVKNTSALAKQNASKPSFPVSATVKESEVIARNENEKKLQDITAKKEEFKKEEFKKEEPKKEEVKPIPDLARKDEPVAPEVKPVSETKTLPATNYRGGFFRTKFEQAGKEASGISGIFKSTSGWNDGKYYALMNNVPVGTIVKVNFPSTNKSIYAKVLGQLPEMRESTGLTIRISDAAAAELGAGNNKFAVDVKY